jgi:hypothetical protein
VPVDLPIGLRENVSPIPRFSVAALEGPGSEIRGRRCGRPAVVQSASELRIEYQILYFVFDVLILRGRDVMHGPLWFRRKLRVHEVLPKLAEPIRYMPPVDVDLPTIVRSAKEQGCEG